MIRLCSSHSSFPVAKNLIFYRRFIGENSNFIRESRSIRFDCTIQKGLKPVLKLYMIIFHYTWRIFNQPCNRCFNFVEAFFKIQFKMVPFISCHAHQLFKHNRFRLQ